MERLKKLGFPGGMISGILLVSVLGAAAVKNLDSSFYQNRKVFPESVDKTEVIDGDMFIMDNGLSVRLLGVNAPDRGQPGFESAANWMTNEIKGQKLWLEYDRYQLDQFGRVLAWVWIGCETTHKFFRRIICF